MGTFKWRFTARRSPSPPSQSRSALAGANEPHGEHGTAAQADRYRVRHWHISGHVSLFDFDAKLEGTMALAAISDLSGHRVRME